jgi:iron complex outermembrane receptor protein
MRRNPNKGMGKASLLSATAAVALTQGGAALAQVFEDEVVVTAQKREESAQDVGIAITAVSGEQLRALGLTNAQDVTALSPGVSTIQPNGEANYAVGIRGVANNDFTSNVESPVAIYVDETYISQMSGAGFLLFDIDRVEILRGPQGTLFGRNATGGLVHYITAKPTTEDVNGYGSLTYGSFNRVKAQGAVNLPLGEALSARLSLATHQGGGYVENRLAPDKDLNNANETAGRIQLRYEPNDQFDLLLNGRFGRQDIRTGFFEYASAILPTGDYTPGVPNPDFGGYVDTDNDRYAGDYDFVGRNETKTWGATARFDWDIGLGTLTNITDFQSVKRDYVEDSDASPANWLNFFLTTDSEQFSQELRLAGDTEKLKWVMGFYYLDIGINDSNGAKATELFAALFGPVGVAGFNGIRNPYMLDTRSWSLFGQAEYALTDQLSLIAGLRYIDEKKDYVYDDLVAIFPEDFTGGLDPRIVDVAPSFPTFSDNRHDTNFSWRAQLNYKPTDGALLYASYNRGVKSGGYNAPLLPTPIFITPEFMTYDPEKLDAYEVGAKIDLGPARFNAAAFYYDYKNCQAFSILGLDTFTLNADCKNKGFEAELQGSAAKGLDYSFGVGFTDAEVTDIPGVTIDAVVIDNSTMPATTLTLPAVVPGGKQRPVQTPKWNLNGLLRYETPLGGSSGNVAFQVDGQYRSEHFFALTNFRASRQGGYFVGNASIAWISPDERYTVRGFVHNVLDRQYLAQTFDLSGSLSNGGLFGLVEQYYARPRTWGVNLTTTF